MERINIVAAWGIFFRHCVISVEQVILGPYFLRKLNVKLNLTMNLSNLCGKTKGCTGLWTAGVNWKTEKEQVCHAGPDETGVL